METFIGCPYCGDRWLRNGDTVRGGDVAAHMSECEFGPSGAQYTSIPGAPKERKSLAEQYEDAVKRGDLEEMLKLRDEAIDPEVKKVERNWKALRVESEMSESKRTPLSKEDKIIRLLEQILERMPPKPIQ